MKPKLLLSTCILFLFVTAVNAQKPDAAKSGLWQQYKVNGEVFSVALPVLPAMHISHKWIEGDKKPRREVWLGSYADGVVYTVYVVENFSPQESLQQFIARRTDSDNGRDVKRDGLSGKSFGPGRTGDAMAQYFASEDRLYSFGAFGASPEDPRMTKFFSSVSFNKKSAALEVFEGPGLPYEQNLPAAAAGDEAADRNFTGKEVTTKARLAMRPEPSYTEDARQNAIAGTVVLKCVFSSNGSVTNIRIVSGLPYGLTQKAIEAAKRIKFLPAVKDGKFVSMWMQLEYNFNLY